LHPFGAPRRQGLPGREDTWSENLSFGISMAVLMLGIFLATDIRKRAGKN
jgi:hypothetical protein